MMNHLASVEEEQINVKSRIESLKEKKASLGKALGQAKSSGQDVSDLIAQLKAVSDELKDLKKTLKRELNARDGEEPPRWMPQLGDIPDVILNVEIKAFEVFDYFIDRSRKHLIDDYVVSHKAGTIWHLTDASESIVKTYGHAARYFFATDENGEIVGVLPLVQLKSAVFGNFIVSVPYFNYGGILANNHEVALVLLEKGNEWRAALGSQSIELRHLPNSGLDLPKRLDKLSFWLPLPEHSDSLWASFQPKVRAQIRKGERENLEVQFGRTELLGQFYDVFTRNMRDLGTPVYGRIFFRNLLDHLQANAWLVVVRRRGRPVGCAFLTGFGGRMEIPWASTLREHNHAGVNMLMYWRILDFAVANGFQVFDFGRCSKDAGTYRFKQQWGAISVSLNWEYLLEDGAELPELNPDNPKFRLLIAIWKRLPVWLSRLIGPKVVKYLP